MEKTSELKQAVEEYRKTRSHDRAPITDEVKRLIKLAHNKSGLGPSEIADEAGLERGQVSKILAEKKKRAKAASAQKKKKKKTAKRAAGSEAASPRGKQIFVRADLVTAEIEFGEVPTAKLSGSPAGIVAVLLQLKPKLAKATYLQ